MRAPALLLFAFVAAFTASAACSNQGEGDVCDINNGNNDCQSGLSCVSAPGLSGTVLPNNYRCCPVLPALPTTSVCALNTSTVFDASTEVPDGTTGVSADAATSDAPAADAQAGPGVTDAASDAVAPALDAALDGAVDGAADASPE